MSEQGGSGVKPGNGGGVKPGGVRSRPARPSRAAGEAAEGRHEERREAVAAPQGRVRDVRVGWGRYLVASRPVGLLGGGVPPIDASALFALLEEDPDVEPVAQVRPLRSRGLGAIAGPHPACPPVAVVAMPEERARALAVNPQVVVEIDQPLSYTPAPVLGGVNATPLLDPMLAVTLEEPERIRVLVKGSDGEVLPGAHVWAIGAAPVHGVTDREGRVSLRLSADTPATLWSLYVRPAAGYWPRRIGHPLPASGGGEIIVEVRALAETFEGFPGRAMTGWGIQAMRLHQLPPTYRGHGIKIALMDSGVNTAHPDLKEAVTAGHDFTGASDAWQTDATGHGTWCAGVIAAADNHSGITGIASEAELHALKLFPGGRVSDLLQAVDYCVAHDIDIAQISLAYTLPSQLVAWKL
ncbi:S8 family serine peptidase, partial [Streptomyces sp. NPDC056534]|uniref:S8 family serine peptidase n=1 Tax=Streptomyces sp. NPDC056534 TaxID=3345857 RepID=UPI0036B90667